MNKDLMKNPHYLEALQFIRENDLKQLENGKHLINDENVFVIITDAELRSVQNAKLEIHDRYIDLQIPLDAEETFGIKKREDCTLPEGEMNPEDDIQFFNDEIPSDLPVYRWGCQRKP